MPISLLLDQTGVESKQLSTYTHPCATSSVSSSMSMPALGSPEATSSYSASLVQIKVYERHIFAHTWSRYSSYCSVSGRRLLDGGHGTDAHKAVSIVVLTW